MFYKEHFTGSDFSTSQIYVEFRAAGTGGARGATGPPKVSESQCIRGYWPPQSFQGPLVVAPSKIFCFRQPCGEGGGSNFF